jgi:hypothetical protein
MRVITIRYLVFRKSKRLLINKKWFYVPLVAILDLHTSRLYLSNSNIETKDVKFESDYFKTIKETSKQVINDKIYYVETTGNREQMLSTVNKSAA